MAKGVLGLAECGIREGKLRVCVDRRLKGPGRIEILPDAREIHPLVIGAERIDGLRGRLECLGLELVDPVGGEVEALADLIGERVDCRRQRLFVRGGSGHRGRAVGFDVPDGRGDLNLVAEPHVLSRDRNVGVGYLYDAAQDVRVDGLAGRQLKVGQHLMDAVARQGTQMRGLADVGAQSVSHISANPVELRIAGGVVQG